MLVMTLSKPEHKFFLEASVFRNQQSTEKSTLEDIIKQNTHWDFIVPFAINQGIAPLMYKKIQQLELEHLLEKNAFDKLKNAYYLTFTKNTILTEALKEILLKFSEACIETVLLKGIALAHFVYKDPGLRPMTDVDIMVHPDKLFEAEKILLDMGYVNRSPYKSHKLRTLNIQNHLNAFVKQNVKIELHWDLSSIHHINKIPTGKIWQLLAEKSLDGLKVFVPDTETNLQYLALHTLSHLQKKNIRVNNFADMAQLLINDRNIIDWDLMAAQCGDYKITKPVFNMLALIHRFYDLPSQECVFGKADKGYEGLCYDFELLLDNKTALIKYRMPSDYFKKIKAINGYKNKFRYMWAELFPSSAFIRYTYKLKPGTMIFPYYFVQFYRQTIKTLFNFKGLFKHK